MSIGELFRLDGRIALVTGGGRGLGEQIALAMAEAGATVLICSRKLEACEAVAAHIGSRGGTALGLACDVSSESDVDRVVEQATATFGAVDILVNNSGATWGASPIDMPVEQFDRVMEVNVRGAFLMSRAVAGRLIDSESPGSIINIGSILAFKASRPGLLEAAGYAASKGALASLTRDLAGSWAGHRIRVNCIAPGWFPTRMSAPVLGAHSDEMTKDIPLGRFGEPRDIQGAAIYLASEASAFVTGHTLVVDGGQTIW